MHFVFFDDFKPGILVDEMVYDISSIMSKTGMLNPQEIIQHVVSHYDQLLPEIVDISHHAGGVPVGSVRLRAPVPKPSKLLCAWANYIEEGRERRELEFFLKSTASIIGPGDTIELPDTPATVFHHEAELAVVIKRLGKKVSASEAMHYVYGYTGFIDVSARGFETLHTTYMKKSFDTFGPMGPALVTADEIPDPHNLRVRLWVNDDLRQDFNTSAMANRIERLIEVTTSVTTLFPGDVISTGTHHKGLGPLQDGDVVTLEIERIGRMSMKIVDPLRRVWER